MQPKLVINGHDYTEYVAELSPTPNALDADGSGRDIQTGKMYRTLITDKLKWEVRMLRMPEVLAKTLYQDLMPTAFFTAQMLSPTTDTLVSKQYYCSSISFGTQRYFKSDGVTYYDGITFNMTER